MVTLQLVLTLFGAEQHLLEPNQLPLYRLESNLRQGQQPIRACAEALEQKASLLFGLNLLP
ncbi:Uncharacterised protein [Vibrio cholerae]|nr:Uncharacterised protein [Vibrio cholerae]